MKQHSLGRKYPFPTSLKRGDSTENGQILNTNQRQTVCLCYLLLVLLFSSRCFHSCCLFNGSTEFFVNGFTGGHCWPNFFSVH